MNIIEKKENKLLERIEVVFKYSSKDKTPSRKELVEDLVKEFGHNRDLIVITKIETQYGSKQSIVYAYLYKDEKAMKKIEKEYILKRNNLVEEKQEKKG